MQINEIQIKTLKDSYESNRLSLKEINDHINQNGCLDNGLSEVEESFEQGWNNALEYVFRILNIQ